MLTHVFPRAQAFVFEQGLLPLRQAQAWFEAAHWHETNGHAAAARELWTRAVKVVPSCEPLLFSFSRFEEAQGNAKAAKELLEGQVAARPSALGYIQLMRLCWRLGEQKDARKAFKKARADPCLSWQVFDAAAQCELCLSLQADEGAQVAARIYAMGVDKFPTEVPLLLRYLRFLQAARDHTNMRALLEKSLQAVTGEGSRELWREYVELEVAYGDAASVRAVADRRAAVFPEYDPASLFSVAAQYAYAGVWPATPSALTPPPQPAPPTPAVARRAAAARRRALKVGGGQRGAADGPARPRLSL